MAGAFILSSCFAPDADRIWSAESLDQSVYADLLQKYVTNGEVSYQGFKKEEASLDRYLGELEKTDTGRLSRNEQLAFYINAYNGWTIKLILSKYPNIKSIKELGSLFATPWKKKICRIDGKLLSLDDIEHGIIRPRFQDPRIHFAVNCAAKGCPPLLSEPYQGSEIDRQLEGVVRAFINDPARNRLEGNILYVSKIFDWYGEDFKEGVIGFFLKYGEGDLKKDLTSRKDRVRIEYLDYDWSLNGS